MTEWKPGDRALLPVEVRSVNVGMDGCVRVRILAGAGAAHVVIDPEDLIPDDRRPDWLPGQPCDVAEWGGTRWMRRNKFWVAPGRGSALDADVPADAVLVLPAKTRKAKLSPPSDPDRVLTNDGWE